MDSPSESFLSREVILACNILKRDHHGSRPTLKPAVLWRFPARPTLFLCLPVACIALMLGGCGNTGPQEESSDPATVIAANSTQVTTAYPSTDASVRWRVWNAAAIAEAQRLERPLLLYVATAGADGLLAEEDELVRSLAQERFVPVRCPWYSKA